MTIALFLLLALLYPQQADEPQQDWSEHAWNTIQLGLGDNNADKRTKAVRSLALLVNRPRASTLAEKALDDSNAEVRAEAATTLGQLGAKSAQPKLHKAINDTDIKVAVAAANALYAMKDPVAYEVYYALLTGELKGPGLLKTQLNTFKDRKEMEKLMLETGIGFVPFGGMGWEAFRTLTHDDSSPIRALATERLASDSDPKTSEALAKACSDKQWRVRAAAVDAIAKRDETSLLSAVRPLLFDENDQVRYEAAAAVIVLSDKTHRRSALTPR
jgi:HEAT repeat protein